MHAMWLFSLLACGPAASRDRDGGHTTNAEVCDVIAEAECIRSMRCEPQAWGDIDDCLAARRARCCEGARCGYRTHTTVDEARRCASTLAALECDRQPSSCRGRLGLYPPIVELGGVVFDPELQSCAPPADHCVGPPGEDWCTCRTQCAGAETCVCIVDESGASRSCFAPCDPEQPCPVGQRCVGPYDGRFVCAIDTS